MFDANQDVLIKARLVGQEDPARLTWRAEIKGTDGKCCHEVPQENIQHDYPTVQPQGLALPWTARKHVHDATGQPVKHPDQVRYAVAAVNEYASLQRRLAILERAYVELVQQAGHTNVTAGAILGTLYANQAVHTTLQKANDAQPAIDAAAGDAETQPAPAPTPQVMLSSEEADTRQAAYDQLRQENSPDDQAVP